MILLNSEEKVKKERRSKEGILTTKKAPLLFCKRDEEDKGEIGMSLTLSTIRPESRL